MRGIILLALLLLAVVLLALVAGSQWTFLPSRPLIVYGHIGGPINALPVVASVKNERVEIEHCYFDKDDAYYRIRLKNGGFGYSFDHDQKYDWGWHRPATWEFSKAYDCWRLVSQFGRK